MRIYLDLSPNTQTVPYDCQPVLVGAFHKWLGKDNPHHDDLSLYSMSWLKYAKTHRNGMEFPDGARMFIASPDKDLLYKVIQGIQESPALNWGMEVAEVRIRTARSFGSQACLFAENPILVKAHQGSDVNFLYPSDPHSSEILTEVMQRKLERAGLGRREFHISFDTGYKQAKTRKITYKGIENKASICPVILKGDPEALAFAYDAGVGHSTGIGFGALR